MDSEPVEQDLKGPFWVVYEGIQPGIYDSWGKAALQVNDISRSSGKKFATFFDAFDSFTTYCLLKLERDNCQPRPDAITAAVDTIADEDVDRVVDEFSVLWLSPHPTELPMPRTLFRSRK